LKVHIIDGDALLAIQDVVHGDHLGEVFSTMNEMVVSQHTLLVARAVVDALGRWDRNGPAYIWADATTKVNRAKVPYEWKIRAQDEAQKAGFQFGLEDTLGDNSSGAVEIAAQVLFRESLGQDPIVVTEDWSDKPLRPALGKVCNRLGWPTCRLVAFLEGQGLRHCLP
jgi:hypothetical protein